MDPDKLSQVVQTYLFTGRTPLRDSIIGALQNKPKILERKTIAERIIEKLREFIQTFEEGWG